MTLQIPMLLALLGTALMAVAIFAPRSVAAPATVSLAPPSDPAAITRWASPSAVDPPDLPAPAPSEEAVPSDEPGWPALVDPRACGCDASARIALVDALAAVRAPWAQAILERAWLEESDALVRERVDASLREQALSM